MLTTFFFISDVTIRWADYTYIVIILCNSFTMLLIRRHLVAKNDNIVLVGYVAIILGNSAVCEILSTNVQSVKRDTQLRKNVTITDV